MRHNRPGERKRTLAANPSDDPSTRERDEWKARTRIEGDSKAPSASIASNTCCKAGARGKHTRSVVTTPGSVIGEEKSLEQGQVNRPEEWPRLPDSASNAHHRYCGGGATPKLRKEQPNGKSHSSPPSIDLGVTKTPKKKERGKNGRQAPRPPLQLATRVEGDDVEDGYRAGRTSQRCSLLRIRSRRHRQHPRRLGFRGKQG